jgi:hypothetical protein
LKLLKNYLEVAVSLKRLKTTPSLPVLVSLAPILLNSTPTVPLLKTFATSLTTQTTTVGVLELTGSQRKKSENKLMVSVSPPASGVFLLPGMLKPTGSSPPFLMSQSLLTPPLMRMSTLRKPLMLSGHGLPMLVTTLALSLLSPSSRPMTLIGTSKLAILRMSGLSTAGKTSKLLTSSSSALPPSPLPPA